MAFAEGGCVQRCVEFAPTWCQLTTGISYDERDHHRSGCLQGFRVCYSGYLYLSFIPIIVMGAMGAAQCFSAATMGWTTLGLGAGMLAMNLCTGIRYRKWHLICLGLFSATLITLGALGGTGILSTYQVGVGVLSTLPASIPLFGAMGCCLVYSNDHRFFGRQVFREAL